MILKHTDNLSPIKENKETKFTKIIIPIMKEEREYTCFAVLFCC